MYCPSCAAETSDDQRYCRNCGNDLRPEEPRQRGNPFRNVVPGIIVLMIGVILGIIDKRLIHNDVLSTVSSIIAVLGAFWMMLAAVRLAPAAARYDRQLLSGRNAKRSADGPTALPSPATNKLPSADHFEPVGSVVENTTELLKQPKG